VAFEACQVAIPYIADELRVTELFATVDPKNTRSIRLLTRLGLTNGVLVHPSAYGEDYSLLLHALSTHANLRGVIVARATTALHLEDLRAQGVRGARFSHRSGPAANFSGSASIDDLFSLAPKLAAAALHAELWTDCKALPDIAARLRTLPIALVIDHSGGFDVGAGVDDPGFRCLLSLVETGHVWVKLCAYRNTLHAPSIDLAKPFHDQMLAANAAQLVWGSDWPHLNVKPAPDTARLRSPR